MFFRQFLKDETACASYLFGCTTAGELAVVDAHIDLVDDYVAAAPQGSRMTYVVTENCIKCKYMDCVEVCPVDCFYEGENMLVIHPDECIDCGVCEPECPAEAIKPDTEPALETWLKLNADLAKSWPNITQKKEAPADAKQWDGVPQKYEKFFTPNPGEGD